MDSGKTSAVDQSPFTRYERGLFFSNPFTSRADAEIALYATGIQLGEMFGVVTAARMLRAMADAVETGRTPNV
jgi:hypothetical protein